MLIKWLIQNSPLVLSNGFQKLGPDDGLVVSWLAFYFDDPSSNADEVTIVGRHYSVDSLHFGLIVDIKQCDQIKIAKCP